jgi:hypothetical protein
MGMVQINKMSNHPNALWQSLTWFLAQERNNGVFYPLYPLSEKAPHSSALNSIVKAKPLPNYYNGFVYFLYSKTFNLVKIGRTVNPKGRFQRYLTESPEALEKTALFRCEMDMEYWLHNGLHKYRKHGEWFSVTDGLKEELHTLLSHPLASYALIEAQKKGLGKIASSAYSEPNLTKILTKFEERRFSNEATDHRLPTDTCNIVRTIRSVA